MNDEHHITLPSGVHVHGDMATGHTLYGSHDQLRQIRDQINSAIGIDMHAARMAEALADCREQLRDCQRRVRSERECSNLA